MNETGLNISEKISETLGQVGTMYRTAGRKVHDARVGTADAINGSASTVRDTGDSIDQLAESAAARLDATAAYVRNYDPGDIITNLEKVVRRYPARFITGAAAAGFLFGFAARKKWIA